MKAKKSDLLTIECFDKVDQWRGCYTLGILSKPIWMTVSSQQMRAAILAKEFVDEINKNTHTLPKKNSRINIAIIGGGIGGLTLAYTLQAYRQINQDFTISIELFEKHDVLCPIQRGCHTRRLHPGIQFWPEPYEDEFSIDFLKGHAIYEHLKWIGGGTAAEISSKTAEIYFKFFSKFSNKTTRNNNITIYQGCKYLKINKPFRSYEIAYSGYEIIDCIGNTDLATGVKNNYDAIFFCTGFGIEREFSESNFNVHSKKYWRNDSLGQLNLNDEPHRYLISGNGDGAVSDALRALIIDFKPDKLLESIRKSDISELINKSYNTKTKVNESNKHFLQSKLESLIKETHNYPDSPQIISKNFNDTLSNFNNKWNDIKWGLPKNSPHKSPFRYISEILIWPRIKNNTEIICHFEKSDDLSEVINNPNVTFYNKFFFYSLWAAGKIKISTGSLKAIAEKYDIKKENILIRHGADSITPITSLISNKLEGKFNFFIKKNLSAKLSETNQLIKNYREGKYIYNKITEEVKVFRAKKISKLKINQSQVKFKKYLTANKFIKVINK